MNAQRWHKSHAGELAGSSYLIVLQLSLGWVEVCVCGRMCVYVCVCVYMCACVCSGHACC